MAYLSASPCFILPLMITLSSMSYNINLVAARHLMETTFPEIPKPELPQLPPLPKPELPELPKKPELPKMTELPAFAHLAELPKPTLPAMPSLPKDIPTHSTYSP